MSILNCSKERRTGSVPLIETRAFTGVESLNFDDRIILLREGSSQLAVLNDTARLIWEMIETGLDLGEIASMLSEGFGIPHATARLDVARFVKDLRTKGITRKSSRANYASSEKLKLPAKFDVSQTYKFGDQPVIVYFDRANLADSLYPLLHPCVAKPCEDGASLKVFRSGDYWIISDDAGRIDRTDDEFILPGTLINRILELSYPDARFLALLHAGGVVVNGGVVILAGGKGSGKSTLTASLVAHGLPFVGDDLVPIDGRTGNVMPAPFAIGAKQGSWAILKEAYPEILKLRSYELDGTRVRYLNVSSKRCGIPPNGLPVRSIVFPMFDANGQGGIQKINALQALEQVTSTGSWISTTKADLSTLLRIFSDIDVFLMRYDYSEMAIDLFKKIFKINLGYM